MQPHKDDVLPIVPARVDRSAAETPSWQGQVSSAITGTAAISAGLAMPFMATPAVGTLATEADPSQIGYSAYPQFSQQSSSQLAFDQGQGVSPTIAQPGQAAFSPSFSSPFSTQGSNNHGFNAYGSHGASGAGYSAELGRAELGSAELGRAELGSAELGAQSSMLTQKPDGSWSLAYNATPGESSISAKNMSAEVAPSAIATQTIVSQLAREAVERTESVCLDNSCKGLSYVQAQLPKANQAVEDAQQKLDAFVAQHGQSDMTAYQRVLAERISEITSQKGEIAIELIETQRHVAHLKSRLSVVNVSTELPKHLLELDADYQSAWADLKQTERALLEEFSQANVDATALNRIYNRYEQQQAVLYETAQATLGNYLLSPGENRFGGSDALKRSLSQVPAVLDLLQALTVATHQSETQQLRQQTLLTAEERLQSRHRSLAVNMSEYESLQRELTAAKKLVSEYEQERDRIATEAANAAPVIARSLQPSQATRQASSVFASAALLEAQLPGGSTAKAVLGIVVAAGAVAVAAARQSGGMPGSTSKRLSKGLYLEIAPKIAPRIASKARSRFGLAAATSCDCSGENNSNWDNGYGLKGNRQQNPVEAGWIAELAALTGSEKPSLAAVGPFEDEIAAILPPLPETELSDRFSVETMSRDLKQLVAGSTPEALFADEVNSRTLAPVQLPIAQIDAFAERAVLWVLKDLSTSPAVKCTQKVAVDVQSDVA